MLTRRSLIASPAILAAAALPIVPALARAPLAGTSPAVYRFKVGTVEVTALADGAFDAPLDYFPQTKTETAEVDRLLRQAALPKGPVRTFVNTYLVNTGDRLVLVDTGTGTLQAFGPTLGQLPKALAAAGVEPAAVDMVVLTHLHPDHELGLAPQGAAFFPNAEVVVAEAEHAFWTDAGQASRAPADVQPFFKMAVDSLKPYGDRVRRVKAGEIAPGLALESAPGHTPGHAMLHVASGGEQILIGGDVVHAAALQFDQPDWSFAFDADPAQAAATRRRVFDRVAADRTLLAACHLPFPGIGRVGRRGQAYAYVPEPWQG